MAKLVHSALHTYFMQTVCVSFVITIIIIIQYNWRFYSDVTINKQRC
jgi:hypothetical protein